MEILSYNELPPLNSDRWLSLEDLPGEEWRDVVGFEGFYLVSSYGRIKTAQRIELKSDGRHQPVITRILKLRKDTKSYLRAMFSVGGVVKGFQAHRIVAKAFINNPHLCPQVNHKDENPLNNCVNNLEWCTAKYNLNYGTRNKRASISRSKPVMQCSLTGDYVNTFYGTLEAERQLGIKGASANISACCRGVRPRAYGYIWRYI